MPLDLDAIESLMREQIDHHQSAAGDHALRVIGHVPSLIAEVRALRVAAAIFPRHIHVFVSHDEHRVHYQTIREWVDVNDDFNETEKAWLAECEAADSCWRISLYPSTPIGFHMAMGPTFEIALARIRELAGA